MSNGFIKEGTEFIVDDDLMFAVWSTNMVRDMVKVPRGLYRCLKLERMHTHETVATFERINDLIHGGKVFERIIFEGHFGNHFYTTGRQKCWLRPYSVKDTVNIVRTGKSAIIVGVHEPAFFIIKERIWGWPEASYTLSGYKTRFWHHELLREETKKD